jgi:hypothetical protein
MNCESCKNYAPVKAKKKPVVTTVKVWEPNIEGDGAFIKYTYQFKGKPDIDRVIAETLKQGALAIKIECTEVFTCNGLSGMFNDAYFWVEFLNIKGERLDYKGYCSWVYFIPGKNMADSDIEAAITEYIEKQNPKPAPEFRVGQLLCGANCIGVMNGLEDYGCYLLIGKYGECWHLSKPRPATETEKDKFYTCELAGKKVRAYEDNVGDIFLRSTDRNFAYMLVYWKEQARAICEAAHIPIMPYSESDGNYKAPKGA